MRTTKILAILLLLPFMLTAQKDYKLGEIDRSYFEMTHCPWDSSAGAFYILDYGTSRFDHNLEVEMTIHVRLKILKSSEFDRADVSIPYYLKDGVPKVKAFTYNLENGEVVTSELNKEGIFKNKIIDTQYELKFTLPNVREGSIIEYQYTVNQGSFYHLNTWYFQTSIPVEKSEYHIYIPNWLTYQRLMTPYLALNVADVVPENGIFAGQHVTMMHHHYEAWKVPAFKREPNVASYDDVISKLDFELRTVQVPNRPVEQVLGNSYAEFAKKMTESDYWTKEIQKAPWAQSTLEVIVSNDDTNLVKAKKIFDYIKAFDKSDDSSLSLKKCLDAKSGTDSELNRLLIALLNQIGLKAEPVRISTRSNGKLHPTIPIVNKFNHTIARLKADDQEYLLDASEKYSEFGVLPKYCVNGKGLVVNGTEEWVELNPIVNNGVSTAVEMEVVDGLLAGKLQIKRRGYEATEFSNKIDKMGLDEYQKSQKEQLTNWSIADHTIERSEDVFVIDEKFDLELEGKVEDLGNLIYISPIVFNQLTTNPFKTEDRKYPVNFGVTQADVYFGKIKIPNGYQVESLPQAMSMALPENGGSLTFNVSVSGDEVVVIQRYKINKIEFSPEEYAFIREFHARIVEKHSEQIVLRRL